MSLTRSWVPRRVDMQCNLMAPAVASRIEGGEFLAACTTLAEGLTRDIAWRRAAVRLHPAAKDEPVADEVLKSAGVDLRLAQQRLIATRPQFSILLNNLMNSASHCQQSILRIPPIRCS